MDLFLDVFPLASCFLSGLLAWVPCDQQVFWPSSMSLPEFWWPTWPLRFGCLLCFWGSTILGTGVASGFWILVWSLEYQLLGAPGAPNTRVASNREGVVCQVVGWDMEPMGGDTVGNCWAGSGVPSMASYMVRILCQGLRARIWSPWKGVLLGTDGWGLRGLAGGGWCLTWGIASGRAGAFCQQVVGQDWRIKNLNTAL